ncbi:MAG: hypothetical protein ACR5LB_10510 [Wolbachia sp.]
MEKDKEFFLSGLLIILVFHRLQERFHQVGSGCLVVAKVKQMLLNKMRHSKRDLRIMRNKNLLKQKLQHQKL